MSRPRARRHLPLVDRRRPQLPAYPKLPPKAARSLHYAGDRRGALWQIMGPNTFGERMTVVEASYDPDLDRTTLGLAYGIHAAPPEATDGSEPICGPISPVDDPLGPATPVTAAWAAPGLAGPPSGPPA